MPMTSNKMINYSSHDYYEAVRACFQHTHILLNRCNYAQSHENAHRYYRYRKKLHTPGMRCLLLISNLIGLLSDTERKCLRELWLHIGGDPSVPVLLM